MSESGPEASKVDLGQGKILGWYMLFALRSPRTTPSSDHKSGLELCNL